MKINTKYLFKIRINNSQNNSISNLSSRNQLYTLNKNKNTTFSSNKNSLRKKKYNEHNSNRFNFKKILDFSQSQILSNSIISDRKEYCSNKKKINNMIKTNLSTIILKNNSSSLPNIKKPKIITPFLNSNNETSYNSSLSKNDISEQKNKLQTQRYFIKSKSIIKEEIDEKHINKIYYKIFPKHIREKPVEKITVINNLFNYYCCNNNEQFEQLIIKENERRKNLKKPLIKLSFKNDDTNNKIKTLRYKTKFIGNIINYCYPKAFIYKINQKTKQLELNKKKIIKKFTLPTKAADRLKKKENDKLTIDLINNSFNIINMNHKLKKSNIL